MSTGETWISLGASSLLNLSDLTTNLRDNVIDGLALGRVDVFPEDGTIGTVKVTVTYNAGKYLIVGAGVGVDNAGHRMASDALAPWSNVPFPDIGAVAYSIGARYQVRPGSVTANTADGTAVYDTLVEDVGELGAPDLVTDNGNGTVTLRINGLVGAGWVGAATRSVVAYLVNPVTGSASAIYTGTASLSGGNYVVTPGHQFGQSGTPSTTVGDYRVIVRGPTVSAIGLSSSYWVLGACNTGVVNTSPQVLIMPPGSWSSVFGAEHDTGTGKHTAINPTTVAVGGVSGVKVSAKGFDGADDTNNPKFKAVDSGNNSQVEILTDANAGGRIKFPLANMGTTAGARLDVRQNGAGTVKLWITNDRSNTDYADLEIDGVIRWNLNKSANTWKITANTAGNQILHVTNDGAGRASLTLDKGDLDVSNGKATIGNTGVDLVGASSEVNYVNARDRYLYLPAWSAFETLTGTPAPSRATNPPYVQDGAAPIVTLAYSLGTLGPDLEAKGMILDLFSCYHNRASATGSIVARLMYCGGSAGSAPVTVTTLTSTNTGGTWTVASMNTSGINHTWIRARHYWIELDINPNGDATLSNYKVHGFALKWTQAKV
jgi:hypothetical protein